MPPKFNPPPPTFGASMPQQAPGFSFGAQNYPVFPQSSSITLPVQQYPPMLGPTPALQHPPVTFASAPPNFSLSEPMSSNPYQFQPVFAATQSPLSQPLIGVQPQPPQVQQQPLQQPQCPAMPAEAVQFPVMPSMPNVQKPAPTIKYRPNQCGMKSLNRREELPSLKELREFLTTFAVEQMRTAREDQELIQQIDVEEAAKTVHSPPSAAQQSSEGKSSVSEVAPKDQKAVEITSPESEIQQEQQQVQLYNMQEQQTVTDQDLEGYDESYDALAELQRDPQEQKVQQVVDRLNDFYDKQFDFITSEAEQYVFHLKDKILKQMDIIMNFQNLAKDALRRNNRKLARNMLICKRNASQYLQKLEKQLQKAEKDAIGL